MQVNLQLMYGVDMAIF